MFRFRTLTSAAMAAGFLFVSTNMASAVDPVKLHWASDHSGPPHPAAIAEIHGSSRFGF